MRFRDSSLIAMYVDIYDVWNMLCKRCRSENVNEEITRIYIIALFQVIAREVSMARRPDKNSFFWLTQREITSNIRVKRKLNICVEEGTLTRMSPSVIEDADSQVLSLSFSSDGESLIFAAYVNGKISEVNMKDDNHYDINLPENYWPWILQLHPSIPRVLAYATTWGNVCTFTIDDDVSDFKSCAREMLNQ